MISERTVWESEPRESVQIHLSDGRTFEGPGGTPLHVFVEAAYPDPPQPIVAALVDDHLTELSER